MSSNNSTRHTTTIDQLPVETLSQIFRTGYESFAPSDVGSERFALTTTAVSRWWREVGLNLPFIWRKIIVPSIPNSFKTDLRPDQLVEKITVYLARAQVVPFDLTLICKISSDEDRGHVVLEVIRPYLERCRSIHVGFWPNTAGFDYGRRLTQRLLPLPCKMPHLVDLHLWLGTLDRGMTEEPFWPRHEFVPIFENFNISPLVTFHLGGGLDIDLSSMRSNTIAELRLGHNRNERGFENVLRHSSATLQCLKIDKSLFLHVKDPISLPSLQHISIPWEILPDLPQMIECPNIATLSLGRDSTLPIDISRRGAFEDINPLLFHRLHTLILETSDIRKVPYQPTIRALPTVSTLYLRSYHSFWEIVEHLAINPEVLPELQLFWWLHHPAFCLPSEARVARLREVLRARNELRIEYCNTTDMHLVDQRAYAENWRLFEVVRAEYSQRLKETQNRMIDIW